MNQSRYGVLVSLCLLLALTAGFFFAARVALKAVNGSIEKAIATATVVILPPSPTLPPATATPKGAKHHAPRAVPTATVTNGGRIMASTSINPSDATKTFPVSTTKFWCLANLPNEPLSAGVTWKWSQVTGNNVNVLYASPIFTYASTLRYSYFNGPVETGTYRCEVAVNGQPFGATDFTVK